MKIMDTPAKIVGFLKQSPRTANDVSNFLGISRQATHRHLARMIANRQLVKMGTPPKVYYSVSIAHDAPISKAVEVDASTRQIIDDNFLYITPMGEKLLGWPGFVIWVTERRQDVAQMAVQYARVRSKYEQFKSHGLINGMTKMTTTFSEVALDAVYYADFYSVEIFGKTKLGQLLLHAKQSQDVVLMKEVIENIRPKVLDVMDMYDIDGVAFVPPTVKREWQFMKVLQKQLALPLRNVSLEKVRTPVVVPQKTLNKLNDRIINAEQTIVLTDRSVYGNVLIIDDAIGSGATMNAVAAKIRHSGICRGKLVGLAITGSANGFDVVNEV
ncbi:hypothetical protein JNJ66_06075 [Candidatus Saccharibacteria bacterium]|nr:hypothetical protein [Candidatus Saccharibacteria bacterium]